MFDQAAALGSQKRSIITGREYWLSSRLEGPRGPGWMASIGLSRSESAPPVQESVTCKDPRPEVAFRIWRDQIIDIHIPSPAPSHLLLISSAFPRLPCTVFIALSSSRLSTSRENMNAMFGAPPTV